MINEAIFFQAIKAFNKEIIVEQLKLGINVNCKDTDPNSYGLTWSAMHHCIFKSAFKKTPQGIEVLDLLLANGADIEITNSIGETPLLFAVKYFNETVLDYLVKNGSNIHHEKLFDIILDRYYYDQQLDEEHIRDEENTKERAAIRKGEGESLRRFFKRIDAVVKHGYNLNSGKYSTAFCAILEIAENKLPAKALLHLFKKGADVRECYKDSEGRLTPIFHLAVYKKLPIDLLKEMAIQIGLDYAFETFGNYNPLLIAISENDSELVKSLIVSK